MFGSFWAFGILNKKSFPTVSNTLSALKTQCQLHGSDSTAFMDKRVSIFINHLFRAVLKPIIDLTMLNDIHTQFYSVWGYVGSCWHFRHKYSDIKKLHNIIYINSSVKKFVINCCFCWNECYMYIYGTSSLINKKPKPTISNNTIIDGIVTI